MGLTQPADSASGAGSPTHDMHTSAKAHGTHRRYLLYDGTPHAQLQVYSIAPHRHACRKHFATPGSIMHRDSQRSACWHDLTQAKLENDCESLWGRSRKKVITLSSQEVTAAGVEEKLTGGVARACTCQQRSTQDPAAGVCFRHDESHEQMPVVVNSPVMRLKGSDGLKSSPHRLTPQNSAQKSRSIWATKSLVLPFMDMST
jgi:hypothetical protein